MTTKQLFVPVCIRSNYHHTATTSPFISSVTSHRSCSQKRQTPLCHICRVPNQCAVPLQHGVRERERERVSERERESERERREEREREKREREREREWRVRVTGEV